MFYEPITLDDILVCVNAGAQLGKEGGMVYYRFIIKDRLEYGMRNVICYDEA